MPTTSQRLTGDMPAEEFRKHGHEIIDWIAEYLTHPERYPVLAQVQPGEIRKALPDHAPEIPESVEAMLADLDRVIVPGVTHWNHPAFFAYFSITGSGPGILGELLSAAFNVNAMLWKTSPAATELEEVTLNWLRQMIGLPESYFGILHDTASVASLCSIAAAREELGIGIREEGMAGRADIPRLRLYTSEQAHSSIEKAAIILGLGQASVRKISTDGEFRMDVAALRTAIEQDLQEGCRPFCVSATIGTTSTTSVDPVPALAEICKEFKLWLHIDAAYAGSAAILPEMQHAFAGWDRADSVVLNPHKWMFTPFDFSALYTRKPDVMRRAFSLVPEYLKTNVAEPVNNFMDYGPALGRRFRALKFWMVLRYFGVEGIRARLREHIAMAKEFVNWVDDSPDFERMAPTPFSVVCFRARPGKLTTQLSGLTEQVDANLDELNEKLLEKVNATGEAFLSHTKLNGRFTLRLAIGNLRTTRSHVARVFQQLQLGLNELCR